MAMVGRGIGPAVCVAGRVDCPQRKITPTITMIKHNAKQPTTPKRIDEVRLSFFLSAIAVSLFHLTLCAGFLKAPLLKPESCEVISIGIFGPNSYDEQLSPDLTLICVPYFM